MDSTRFNPRWAYATAAALTVAVVSIVAELVGFFTGSKALWRPASVVFPISVVSAMVFTAVLIRQLVASRDR